MVWQENYEFTCWSCLMTELKTSGMIRKLWVYLLELFNDWAVIIGYDKKTKSLPAEFIDDWADYIEYDPNPLCLFTL